MTRIGGPTHPFVGPPLVNLAQQELEDTGDYRRAEAYALRSLEPIARRGPDNPDLWFSQLYIYASRAALGDYSGALLGLRAAASRLESALGPTHIRTAKADELLASTLGVLGEHGEAVQRARQAYAALVKDDQPVDPDMDEATYVLALALDGAGRGDEAVTVATRAVDEGAKNLEPNDPYLARARAALCRVLVDQERPAAGAACATARAATVRLRQDPSDGHRFADRDRPGSPRGG